MQASERLAGSAVHDVRSKPNSNSADGVADGVMWTAVRRASLRACLRLAEGSRRERSAEELALHMNPLAHLVWQLAHGEDPNWQLAVPALPVDVLLETLRGELLEELQSVGGEVSVADVISLLKALEAARERLSADPAHRFASRFLGGAGLEALVEVAHDMRSPLTSIVLLVETMRQGRSGPITKVQERQLGLMFGASFGLSLLANDIISLARGDRLVESKAQPFSISEVLNSVREIVVPIAEEKGIELRLVLPQADWRVGFAPALHRVILNLATNALKFTDAGRVELGAHEESPDRLSIFVADTGRGIPPHVLPTLFEAFRQRETGGTITFSSSGLGLSTCRKLLLAMGSDLQVDSLSGSGTRFHFVIDLPRAPRI